jgi:site-specific DNA-methyltransferase (adenine-specific)
VGSPYYQDSHCTIYHGDCREVLPTLEPVDLLCTDPPYGIGNRLVSGGGGKGWAAQHESGAEKWDVRPPKEMFQQLFALSKEQLIWGGNFFELPPCEKPLCWDKVRPNSKCAGHWEYAWTSLTGKAELISHCGNGGFILPVPKEHPTQKPLKVMVWAISFFPNVATILDPFMGSGTTLRAAKDLGRKAIGIEIEERYCEIAAKRLAQEVLPL